MVRAVLFDFYGTLARAIAWGPTVEETLERWGLAFDPDARVQWQAHFADGVDHMEHSVDRERYVAWERTRLRRLAEGCGASPAGCDTLAAELYAASKDNVLEAYEEVPEVLATLRRRGITVAVCSNWDWDLDRALHRTGLDELVDVAVTSAQVGARKPHPRIYASTLERCGGVPPGETLFVGDSWHPDVEGPLAAGLRPVHVWRPEERDGFPAPPAANGISRIPDLRGVLDLLGF